MLINKLFRVMRRRFNCFPDNYLVLDLETTGLNKREDLIGQIGHCLVIDRKPVDTQGTILNWVGHAGVDTAWLKKRLEETKYHVEHDKYDRPSGRVYHLSIEKMLAEGAAPVPILSFYLDWLRELRSQNKFFILHNGYNFDCPFLENTFQKFLGITWTFGDNEVFDTGVVEKASQINLLPWNEESLRAFSTRMGQQRAKGVRWALDNHCAPKYKLLEKYGMALAELHDAGKDAFLTHCLFEEFRKFSEEASTDAATQPAQGPGEVRGIFGEGDPFPADPGH